MKCTNSFSWDYVDDGDDFQVHLAWTLECSLDEDHDGDCRATLVGILDSAVVTWEKNPPRSRP